jgi:hypothetical protein
MSLPVTPGSGAILKSTIDAGEHITWHINAEQAELIQAILYSTASLSTEETLIAVLAALQGTLSVSSSNLPLPAGAATEVTLQSLLTKIIAAPATEAAQTANTARLGDALPRSIVDTVGAPISYTDAAGYPAGSVVLNNSSGNKAATVATATLSSAAGKTTYLTGFDVSFAGATGASIVLMTVAGLLGGTRSYVIAVPAGAQVGGTSLSRTFDPPLPASAVATDIVVSLPSLGTGNTNAVVNAQGYRV